MTTAALPEDDRLKRELAEAVESDLAHAGKLFDDFAVECHRLSFTEDKTSKYLAFSQAVWNYQRHLVKVIFQTVHTRLSRLERHDAAGLLESLVETRHKQLTAETADLLAAHWQPLQARLEKIEQRLSAASKQIAALERKRDE